MRCRALQQPGPEAGRRDRDVRRAGDPPQLSPSAGGHVAALTVELHLPEAHSLKEKRAMVRPILDGSRRRFSVAAAEVGNQEQWQRASLAMAVVSGSVGHAREVLAAVERFVWSFPEVDVLDCRVEWLDLDGAAT